MIHGEISIRNALFLGMKKSAKTNRKIPRPRLSCDRSIESVTDHWSSELCVRIEPTVNGNHRRFLATNDTVFFCSMKNRFKSVTDKRIDSFRVWPFPVDRYALLTRHLSSGLIEFFVLEINKKDIVNDRRNVCNFRINNKWLTYHIVYHIHSFKFFFVNM